MSKVDSSGRKRLLVGSRKLQNVPKGGDGNGTFDSAGPDGSGNAVSNFEDIDTSRQIAVLEIPPHRHLHVSRVLFLASRREME